MKKITFILSIILCLSYSQNSHAQSEEGKIQNVDSDTTKEGATPNTDGTSLKPEAGLPGGNWSEQGQCTDGNIIGTLLTANCAGPKGSAVSSLDLSTCSGDPKTVTNNNGELACAQGTAVAPPAPQVPNAPEAMRKKRSGMACDHHDECESKSCVKVTVVRGGGARCR